MSISNTPGPPLQKHRRATGQKLSVSAAHEINNPIDSVVNLLYLLEREATFTPQGVRYLFTIREEMDRIAQIARKTLEDYRTKDKPQQISLGHLVDDVLGLYRSRLESKSIAVHRQYRFDGTIAVHADRMREVFANLFLNAVDAMTVGGKMTIRMSQGREWRGQKRRGLSVVVADNGEGIRPGHVRRIFEPFFTTKGTDGSGMGLSIVQEIVRQHQGVLRVRSSIRRGTSGTVFSIFLPLPATEAPRS